MKKKVEIQPETESRAEALYAVRQLMDLKSSDYSKLHKELEALEKKALRRYRHSRTPENQEAMLKYALAQAVLCYIQGNTLGYSHGKMRADGLREALPNLVQEVQEA